MFSYRGRSGPSRSTPSNVQCQKCLKRERHYSYECKATAQERPYTSRPSRSQQFRNPKLMPKLTNDSLKPLEQKKGVADEELAKAEAERARKRERDERDDELIASTSKRQRSVSVDSVSTISTGASRSPSPRQRTRSPPPHQRGLRSRSKSEDDLRRAGQDYDSTRSRSRSRSRSHSYSPQPQRQHQRSLSRDSHSPGPRDRETNYRMRDAVPQYSDDDNAPLNRSQHDSKGPRDSFGSRRHHTRETRSSEPAPVQQRRDDSYSFRRGHNEPPRGRNAGNPPSSRGPRPEERERERSLSPFSRRLAMTKAMKEGR